MAPIFSQAKVQTKASLVFIFRCCLHCNCLSDTAFFVIHDVILLIMALNEVKRAYLCVLVFLDQLKVG